MLNDRLRAASKVAQVGEAHPVDARRKTAFPATPDEPRHIEQKGCVVGHLSFVGGKVLGIVRLAIPRSSAAVNASAAGLAVDIGARYAALR